MRRVVLFDIDGTLISGGPAKDAFCEAMLETFSTIGDVEGVSFAGKTDPQIVRELLQGAGYAQDLVESRMANLFARYLQKLEDQLVDRPVNVLPGVPELLAALDEIEDIGVALLTGNILRGAELKLRSAALWHYFELGTGRASGHCARACTACLAGDHRARRRDRGGRHASGRFVRAA